jgi:1,4-dihydroxy-2-naphthoate octaprenyltransferase
VSSRVPVEDRDAGGERPGAAPGLTEAWILAARPKTLPAAASPVLVGTAVALHAGGFRAGPALAALAGALLLQIGSNFANDVDDFERGADREGRTGPLRVTQAGILSAAAVRRGMWIAFGLAAVVGLYLAVVAGWPVVVLGLAAIAAALAYTGGGLAYGYRGLGELFVMIFFGFVAVCGTAWVQALRVPSAAWPAGFAVGCLVTAILVVNNVRDIEQDRASGKRTLTARFGRRWGLAEYGLLMAAAYATPVAMAAARLVPAGALLSLATLPMATRAARELALHEGPALNEVLAKTARVGFLWSALFAGGVAFGVAVS